MPDLIDPPTLQAYSVSLAAKYILATLAGIFLIAGGLGLTRGAGARRAQSRTWLLVGGIFGLVSLWLFGFG